MNASFASLERMEQLATVAENYSLARLARAYRARLCLLQGDLNAATHWLMASSAEVNNDLGFLCIFEELTQVRVLLAQKQREAALAKLVQTEQRTKASGNLAYHIEVLMLTALAYQDNLAHAIDLLSQALALAEPECYIRTFVDEGRPLQQLLSQLLETHKKKSGMLRFSFSETYLQTVLNAYAEKRGEDRQVSSSTISTTPPPNSPSPRLLSKRELDVLRLLADGYSDKEIAQQLVLTEGTVKTHTKRIYRKLDVKNRAQAVTRANILHLLP
jgi:LuxR family maltose regulon positive regulatory protein